MNFHHKSDGEGQREPTPNHSDMHTPSKPSLDTVIWRYMTLDRFLDILVRKQFTLTQAQIAADRNELTLPLRAVTTFNETAKKYVKQLRRSTYISCWAEKESECRLLWHSYLQPSQVGVAIKSTVRAVRSSVDWHYGFTVRRVDYRDVFTEEDIGNNLVIVNTKACSYFEESEIRFSMGGGNLPGIAPKSEEPSEVSRAMSVAQRLDAPYPKIVSLPVEINELVDEVWISPYCAGWQTDIIRELIEKLTPSLLTKVIDSKIKE